MEFGVGWSRIRSAFGWTHKFLTGANGEDGEDHGLLHHADYGIARTGSGGASVLASRVIREKSGSSAASPHRPSRDSTAITMAKRVLLRQAASDRFRMSKSDLLGNVLQRQSLRSITCILIQTYK